MIIGTLAPRDSLIPISFVKSLMATRNYRYIIQEGPSIPLNRNFIFERARIEREPLLFIDSDMVFTPQDVARMEENLRNYDIVSGVCVMSYEGHPPAIFKEIDGKYKVCEIEDKMFEIDACGGAFLGISLKVLDSLVEPFEPLKDEKTGHFHGEDISFCLRAKKEGFKIFCDPSLNIGHTKYKVLYHDRRTS